MRMPRSFGRLLAARLKAESRNSLVIRTLAPTEVTVTEIRADAHTNERSGSLPAEDVTVAVLQLQDFPRHEWWEEGRQAPVTALRAGDLTMYDLRRDPRFTLNHPFHSIHFRLPRALLTTLGSGEIDWRPGQGVDDPVFRHLASSVRPAFDRPAWVSPLFLDGVTHSMAEHLVVTYGRDRHNVARPTGRLSAPQLARVLERIDGQLDGKLTLAALAATCGLSASYFRQAFRRTTGLPPHRWLAMRRVERAKARLADPAASLAAIAFECGFADQSHLTHVFTAMTGKPPGAWRRTAAYRNASPAT